MEHEKIAAKRRKKRKMSFVYAPFAPFRGHSFLAICICVNLRDLRAIPDSVAFCRLDRLSTGAFNARAQGREGAKSFFLLGVLATLRLCDESSFLSVKSVKSVV